MRQRLLHRWETKQKAWFVITEFHRDVKNAGNCMFPAFFALTMLAEYGMVNEWVLEESWGSLMDVVPTMHTALNIYVLLAIVLNTAALPLSRFLTKS